MVSDTLGSDDNALDIPVELRVFLAVYTLSITVIGLLGNSVVVYSSSRYNSLKLDAVSVRFVLSLAVADFSYIICWVLPSAITYIAGKYILGDIFCYINTDIAGIPVTVNTLTVLLLTSYRLFIVCYPHRFISLRCANTLVAATWVVALSPLVVIKAYGAERTFTGKFGICTSDILDKKGGRFGGLRSTATIPFHSSFDSNRCYQRLSLIHI